MISNLYEVIRKGSTMESKRGFMDRKNGLIAELGDLEYRTDVLARSYTSFRIGGPMAFFAEPRSVDELCKFLCAAGRCGYPVYVIGNGSNLLVSDDGVDALFIRICEKMSSCSFHGTSVTADAGALLCSVAKASVCRGLRGLEWAAGIPGTVGGGVAMNAGAYDGEIKQVLKSVRIIKNGMIVEKRVSDGDLGYRYSSFAYPDSIVVSATMELNNDDGCAKALMDEYGQRRRQKQPLEYPSAGSTFKRPKGYFAGKLIEDAGLKGARVGNAMVSVKHAGFIINCGGATFNDVMGLIELVRTTVMRKFKVNLEPEVKIIR